MIASFLLVHTPLHGRPFYMSAQTLYMHGRITTHAKSEPTHASSDPRMSARTPPLPYLYFAINTAQRQPDIKTTLYIETGANVCE